MSTLTLAKPKLRPASLPRFLYRVSVAQYHQMIEAGVLTDDERVELIEGFLVSKMSKKPLRTFVNQNLREALENLLAPGWFVNAQEPITSSDSEPEPDISVVRGKRRDYSKRHPRPKELALVAEVADTSLEHDRGFKKSAYARAGVAVYWVVNLVDQKIEVYSDPGELGGDCDYRDVKYFGSDDKTPFYVDGKKAGTIVLRDLIKA